MEPRDCDCILLAAGLSSRAGGGKLLAPIFGRPLIAHAVSHALCCRRVILVLGHRADAILPAARAAVPPDSTSRLVPVENPRYHAGMFSSIQAGARVAETEWFFVLPADLPDVTAPVFTSIAAAADRAAGGVTTGDPPCDTRAAGPGASGSEPTQVAAIVPEHGGRRGHPVLMHRSVREEILRRDPEDGPMRAVLASFSVLRLPLETAAVVSDLDTPEAIERYGSSSGSHDPSSR